MNSFKQYSGKMQIPLIKNTDRADTDKMSVLTLDKRVVQPSREVGQFLQKKHDLLCPLELVVNQTVFLPLMSLCS